LVLKKSGWNSLLSRFDLNIFSISRLSGENVNKLTAAILRTPASVSLKSAAATSGTDIDLGELLKNELNPAVGRSSPLCAWP
jgi:hypothetical protein